VTTIVRGVGDCVPAVVGIGAAEIIEPVEMPVVGVATE
jgi:hypothetical protein